MNNLNVKKDEDNEDKYKGDNSGAPKSDESVINKTDEDELLTGRFMSMIFQLKSLMM